MSDNYVITITRQFGSLGRPIAQKLSELLGIEYYDRDIVEAAAKKMKLPASTLTEVEESARGAFFQMKYPLGMGTSKIQDNIYATQKELINEYVEKESCVIVGRCSDYILRDYPKSIHVYLYASYEERVVNCVNSLFLKPADAKEMIHAIDKARKAYHKHYAGYLPGDPNHYDVMINTSMFGAEGTAKLLQQIVTERFELK